MDMDHRGRQQSDFGHGGPGSSSTTVADSTQRHETIQDLWKQSLDPPARPTDLIESALFLPLGALGMQHQGRKVRIVGQILAFDPKTGYVLLTGTNIPNDTRKRRLASQTQHCPQPRPTVLVDLTVPLLGISPSATNLSQGADDFWKMEAKPSKAGEDKQRQATTTTATASSKALASEFESRKVRTAWLKTAREEQAGREKDKVPLVSVGKVRPSGPIVKRSMLSLDRGEWVTVVGWLEQGDKDTFRRVRVPMTFSSPLRLMLEAIHVHPSRPPPPDAIYRGQLST